MNEESFFTGSYHYINVSPHNDRRKCRIKSFTNGAYDLVLENSSCKQRAQPQEMSFIPLGDVYLEALNWELISETANKGVQIFRFNCKTGVYKVAIRADKDEYTVEGVFGYSASNFRFLHELQRFFKRTFNYDLLYAGDIIE